jgi:glycosyltransferase involved in cell wall biosynthesis
VYRTAGFHAISESTRDDLVRRGVAADAIRVIHPGVDSTRFTPGPMGGRAPDPTFLYVGRLKRYKGLEIALQAIAMAREEHAVRLRLEIAGSGDDRERLERLVRSLGIAEQVAFLGYISEHEKLQRYRRAWAVVFPSPKEGWGITNVEAAACGTPAVASDSPGLRDSVRHGETGELVPHGDARRLAEALARLARDPALVERYGAAARRFAEELSWEATVSATESHLHDVVARAHHEHRSN